MKKIFAALLFTFFLSSAFAQVKPQTVTKSSVVFHIKNLGITVDGTLAGLKGDIQFDPSNLAGSSMNVSVDVNTIDTDNGTRNDHLKSDSYFDVAKYPAISMKSVSFKSKGGNKYKGTFNLTIKNVTKTIEFPFTYDENGSSASFTGNFQINRRDYGVGDGSMVMGDNVKIDIDVTTSK